MPRKVLIGGNWKCNGTRNSVRELVTILNKCAVDAAQVDVVVAPPSLHVDFVQQLLQKNIAVCAQNVSLTGPGAFTGEIAAEQLVDFGLSWTITGHSERRAYYAESDEVVAKKTKRALDLGLRVIFCIGETLEQRKANQTLQVLTRQTKALADIIGDRDWERVVIAYEPVWAIGTGVVATPAQAQEAHQKLRKWIATNVSIAVANAVRIIWRIREWQELQRAHCTRRCGRVPGGWSFAQARVRHDHSERSLMLRLLSVTSFLNVREVMKSTCVLCRERLVFLGLFDGAYEVGELYEVVRRVARARGWKLVTDEKPDGKPTICNLHWIDVPDILPTFKTLLPYQKVNHLPGMANLACKSKLARNLERMKKLFPSEYDFVPRTWILPFDQYEFQQNFNSEGESQRTFIVKPDHMCQGRGVFLTRKLAQIPRGDVLVAQQYVARPLLIDGKKFDLRIYVLITSCSPLRVYIFKDGLVRMCTADYVTPNADNLEHRFMHLTNYAVNKHSNNFEVNKGDGNEGKGSKRSLRWFLAWLKEIFPPERVDSLWEQIGDICLKSILSVQPTLAQEYRSTFAKYTRRTYSAARSEPHASDTNNNGGYDNGCKSARPASAFESIGSSDDGSSAGEDPSEPTSTSSSPSSSSCCFSLLGMDVLVDEQLKPWLLEVNHLPSFGCDSPLDWSVKEPLISQTFDLLNISASDKERYESEQSRALQQRLYGGASLSTSSSPAPSDNQRAELPPLIPPSPRTNAPEGICEPNQLAHLPLATNQLHEALTNYYAQFNTDRLRHLDKIVTKYADNQEELSRSLHQKYGKRIEDFAPRVSVVANAQQQEGDPDQVEDDEHLIDFVRIYPPLNSDQDSKYRKMLDASQQYIDELQLRFSAPLQHRRPETDSNGAVLPPLKGAQKKELGRDCFGFSGTDKAQWLAAADKKALVVPGPMQVAAAHRLMLGHSSQKLSIKPPTPPEPLHSRSGTPVNYGLQYRERLATRKNKPTLAVSQVSFCFNGPF